MASTSGSSWVTSLRFAPVRIALTGTPLASTRMWCLEPGRARSVGFGPVFRPPQRLAQMKSRRLLVRNPVRLPRVTSPAVACAIASTRRLSASRATVSSRLSPSHIPILSTGTASCSHSRPVSAGATDRSPRTVVRFPAGKASSTRAR